MKRIEILCTQDYPLFCQYKEQREIKPATTAKLQRSMQKRGFVPTKPIIVNSAMEVIDGQHRLRAATNLGLCVYYVVDDKLKIEDVRDLAKAQATWDIEDYVTSHIRQGAADYSRLKALRELSGLSWNAFMNACFSDTEQVRHDVRDGKFNLSSYKEAEILDFIAKFDIFKPICKHWKLKAFAVAASQMFAHPDYEHKQMISRLEYQSTRLVRCALVSDYLAVFQGIYNYKSRVKVVDFTRRPK